MRRKFAWLLTFFVLPLAACTAQEAGAPLTTTAKIVVISTTEMTSMSEISTERTTEILAETTIEVTSDVTTIPATEPVKVSIPVGGSIAQVVAFYNQQANLIKQADRITITKRDVRDMDMQVPAALRAVINKKADEFFHKDEHYTETFVGGKGIKDSALKLVDFLPVNGQPYVSRLKASLVQNATCGENNLGFVVTIHLKEEPIVGTQVDAIDAQAMGYASCMDLGLDDARGLGGIGGMQLPNFVQADAGYRDGAIVAEFDTQGRLVSLTLSYNNYAHASVLGMKLDVNNVARQEYGFGW